MIPRINLKNNYSIKEIRESEWKNYFSKVAFSNYLQSWEYGNAKYLTEKYLPLRFLIYNKNKKPIALAQILIKNFFFFKVARLNRGPLFLNEESLNTEVFLETIKIILAESKKRRWFIFFHAFELSSSKEVIAQLKSLGIHFRKKSAWGSIKISLENSEEEIMKNLKSKWRNMLRKSLKLNQNIEYSKTNKERIKLLVKKYEKFQKIKNFTGIPSDLIENLVSQNSNDFNLNLYNSSNNNHEVIGSILTIINGGTATYTIGWTNKLGRSLNTNYRLLWESIIDSKKKGCKWFDLGGVNSKTPKGIKHFKEGTNGYSYKLIGESWNLSIL